jgi:hypothetical protein
MVVATDPDLLILIKLNCVQSSNIHSWRLPKSQKQWPKTGGGTSAAKFDAAASTFFSICELNFRPHKYSVSPEKYFPAVELGFRLHSQTARRVGLFGFDPTEIRSHDQNCISTLANRRSNDNNTTYITAEHRMTITPTRIGQSMESSGLHFAGQSAFASRNL